jgi:hypothetical protein
MQLALQSPMRSSEVFLVYGFPLIAFVVWAYLYTTKRVLFLRRVRCNFTFKLDIKSYYSNQHDKIPY